MLNQLKMELKKEQKESLRVLKDEFYFNYNKQEIKVKLCGSVYCAIFGEVAKPLIIKIENESVHNGSIKTAEGKHLGFIPDDSFEKIKAIDVLIRIKTLLNSIEL